MERYNSAPSLAESYKPVPEIELAQLTPYQNTSEDSHICGTRAERGFRHWIQAWYLPPLHLAWTLGLWYSMRWQLPDRVLAIGRGPNVTEAPAGRWYQSDLTTMLAILIMVSRILAGLLQVVITWRCIFFLFEKASLSLTELEFISAFQLPALNVTRVHKSSSTAWLVLLVLLLAWPAQFISPLATGALTWIPSIVFDSANTIRSDPVLGTGLSPDVWGWYQGIENVRKAWVQESAGFANLESYLVSNNLSSLNVPPARRPTYMLRDIANGSSIDEAIVPYISISSFEWVSDPTAIDTNLQAAVLGQFNGLLNVSQFYNPLQMTPPNEGIAAPLKATQWSSTDGPPSPHPLKFTKLVALWTSRTDNPNQDPCSFQNSSRFAEIEDIGFLQANLQTPNIRTNCYIIAKMDFVAGTVKCSDTHRNGSRCSLSPSSPLAIISQEEDPHVEPDETIDEIFNMMPEVIELMITTGGFARSADSTARIGGIGLSDDRALTKAFVDPEQYSKTITTLACQGTWVALAENLAVSRTPVSYIEPTNVVMTAVSPWRMYVWLVTHCSLTAASGLLVLLQSKSSRPVLIRKSTGV